MVPALQQRGANALPGFTQKTVLCYRMTATEGSVKDMGPMASLGRGVWGSRGLQGSNQPRVHRTLSELWVVAFCCSWTGCCRAFLLHTLLS